ncbi:FxLD family lanthipeptide [Kibdelosporangium philippinense]|uniref:FxLD family lanthipeptide n=1 Tax=Kibdelosporangium philippinense TaxID=211113 RepID=UPI00355674DD
MPATSAPTVAVAAEFDLDLRVITDVDPGVAAPCATDDGCDPTCASSCTSNA